MMKQYGAIFLVYFSIGLLIAACSKKEPVGSNILQTASPETQNLDPQKLSEVERRIEAGDYGNIHSLIIIRNDHMVMEKYFRGYTREDLHFVYSVTKSVTSALVGIALEQNKVSGLDSKLLSYFPQYPALENHHPDKENIRLEDVLTMSTGLLWDEWTNPYGHPQNDATLMSTSPDWIKHMLDRPMIATPGSQFSYSSGCTMLLSGILQETTGQTAEDFGGDHLFEYLRMKWQWNKGPNNLTNTGWGLFLRPIDIANFGQLYLNGGSMDGEQIISSDWIQNSTRAHIDAGNYNYGYQWWRFKDDHHVVSSLAINDLYFAWGYRGQFLFVIPHLDMVVVSTADNVTESTRTFAFLRDYILGAVLDAVHNS